MKYPLKVHIYQFVYIRGSCSWGGGGDKVSQWDGGEGGVVGEAEKERVQINGMESV